MEAVKRINICDVKNQLRSSHRMQMRRTKKKKKNHQTLETVKAIWEIGFSVEEIRIHGKEVIIYERKRFVFQKNLSLRLEKFC